MSQFVSIGHACLAKELLCSKDDIAPLLPPTLEHPLVPLLTRCQRRHGHLHPAELRTMEPQRWLEALTVTVPPTLTCGHANSVKAAQITLRSRSVIVLAIIFQSSWQKRIWLCKIQDINKLATKLVVFILATFKSGTYLLRSEEKWYKVNMAWTKNSLCHECKSIILKISLRGNITMGNPNNWCYHDSLLSPLPKCNSFLKD